ncbi:MAG: AAA family ATPase [Symploca sp. SIO2E9]|nr:AAA family ATPase [Symploca sp. SIO2E9]
MKAIEDWNSLAKADTPIVALEYYKADLIQIFSAFKQQAREQDLPLYYWNLGYSTIQKVELSQGKCRLYSTNLAVDSDVLEFLLASNEPGIFLLDDLLNLDDANPVLQQRHEAQLSNTFFQSQWSDVQQYWVLMGDYIQLSSKLQPLIPTLKCRLPSVAEVAEIVDELCDRHLGLGGTEDAKISRQRLVRACQGLPRGEICLVLSRYCALTASVSALAELVLEYKIDKLQGEGLEFISEPDVPTAGGMDLIVAHVRNVAKLMSPEAKAYSLTPPKGMLLLGPPGTGKSLTAKLTAKELGVPLLGVSWGNILSTKSPDKTLSKLLEIAGTINAVIFFDDFDKGFAGWKSEADGGVSKRLAQKLLTWMQEHTSNTFVVATINRLEMIPSELRRRFNDMFFVDIPHMGAIYEIFQLHLAKYFPQQFGKDLSSPWTKRQWYSLLKWYLGCTPAEIGNAVKRCAERAFCQGHPGQITLEDLKYQRSQFVLLSETYSEDIQHIRNHAIYARPASSPDNSEFAIAPQELFEYQPPAFDEIEEAGARIEEFRPR